MELHAGLIMKKRFITWWFCCKKTAYYYVIVAFPYHTHLLFGGQPNPIMVGNFAFLFNCTLVGRTSDSMAVQT